MKSPLTFTYPPVNDRIQPQNLGGCGNQLLLFLKADVEDAVILECEASSLRNRIPVVRRYIVPSSSKVDRKVVCFFEKSRSAY